VGGVGEGCGRGGLRGQAGRVCGAFVEADPGVGFGGCGVVADVAVGFGVVGAVVVGRDREELLTGVDCGG